MIKISFVQSKFVVCLENNSQSFGYYERIRLIIIEGEIIIQDDFPKNLLTVYNNVH
jgi:hypothetical protein